MTLLSYRDLVAGYGSTPILEGVSGEVHAGEVICVLGRNGVGKTTLVRSLTGVLMPSRGSVEIEGRETVGCTPDEIVRLGVISGMQEGGIFRELTVAENLALAGPKRSRAPESRDEVLAALPVLRQRMKQRAGTLSGGEQKMLILARALSVRAALVILDEVTEGVQPTIIEAFSALIRDRAGSRGTAFVLVEQNVRFALSLSSRYVVLDAGRVVRDGAVSPETRTDVEEHLVF